MIISRRIRKDPDVKRIAVIGAGGFAREVAWLIRDINAVTPQFEFLGYLVSDLSKLSDHDSRDEVLGDFSWLEANAGAVDAVAFGIGNPQVKLNLGADLSRRFAALEWPALIHPTAQFDRASTSIGRGVVICAGVIGTVNVVFKDYAMVNLACTIGHEAIIGSGAVLNPTVNISGGAILEDGVMIGTGAQILQYKRVGAGATVGAGAVVTKDVPPDDVVSGVPAKSMKVAG
jgi:sugar O-acyltransferase (sialic acid O-acetyltransferase NeuD family)